MRKAKILGTGMFLPERVVPNSELEAIQALETTDAWIQERTGIKERRYADEGWGSSDLGVEAARQAMKDAGLTPDDIDFIVYGTLSSDYVFPGDGVLIQDKLFGERTIGALDVRNQCSGFLYGLTVADSMIKSGQYRHVLVIGAEVHSTALDYTRTGRDVTVIFGDGGGAVVLGPSDEENRGILGSVLHSQGAFASELWLECPSSREHPRLSHDMIEAGRHYPRMNGRMVFKHAVTRMIEVIHEILAKCGRTLDDVDLMLPHQANLRINQMVAAQLGLSDDRVLNTIAWTGNTTAATLPICMCEAKKQGRLKEGDLVLLVTFGAGFTWGAALIQW